jgi:tetratricopeptide (TPR) repeat protein
VDNKKILDSLEKINDQVGIRRIYSQLIQIEPNNTLFISNLGVSYLKSKKPDSAIYLFKRCIQIDSSFIEGYVNLTRVLKGTSKYNEALQIALLAHKKKSFSVTNNLLGDVYYEMGETENAVKFYELSSPDSLTKYGMYNLGTAYSYLERDFESINVLTRLIKIDSSDALSWHARASTYSMMRDFDNARTDFIIAFSLDKNRETNAAFNLSNLYYYLGMNDSACYYFDRAVQFNKGKIDTAAFQIPVEYCN